MARSFIKRVYEIVIFYTGKLVEVTDTYAKLADAALVYETGAFDNKNNRSL